MKTLSRLLLSVVLFVGFLADSSFGKAFGPRAASPAAFSATNAAWYSLAGAPSDSTYLLNSGNVTLIADRSGNSAVNGLVLNGDTAGLNNASTTFATPTGDLEFIVKLASPNYASGLNQPFFSKWGAASTRSFRLEFQPDGTMRALLSTDGTNTGTPTSAVVPFGNFGLGYVKFTRVFSSGKCNFYTSIDGVTWTQSGTVDQVAFAGSNLFDSAASLIVGYSSGLAFTGFVHYATIANAIGGTPVVRFDPSSSAKLATTVVNGAYTWTIATSGDLGARISGARDLVQLTAAKMPAFSVVGGYNTATFDGSNDYMKAAAFSLSQPISRYLISSSVTWTAFRRFFDGYTADSGLYYQVGTTPNIGVYAGTRIDNNALAVGTKGLLRSVINGASSSFGINLANANTGDAGASSMGGVTIGSDAAGDNSANITFNEALLRSVADDATTQNALTAYEMLTWGITP